jgi:hypothetical protein
VAPLACKRTEYGLNVAFRVPPGLAPGRHEARLKVDGRSWSEYKEFFFDLPVVHTAPKLTSIQDGVSWRADEVDWAGGGWVTLWVEGLSAEADCGNLVVEIAGVPHLPDSVDPVKGQVNVKLRPLIRAGERDVRILHRGSASGSRKLRVVGDAPAVRGLDGL